MAKKSVAKPGSLQKGFLLEQFHSLCGKLYKYQIDPELYEARKSVLPFVRGLRFSALLIYTIRNILNNTDLTANWGAILADTGEKCSPECDIVVHEKKDGSKHAWNGDDDFGGRVMDFHFIQKKAVKLVVSCKSCVTQVDQKIKDDIVGLSDYVRNIWLFAECCDAGHVAKLQQAAESAGYRSFYYLYSLKKGDITPSYDERLWIKFAESLLKLRGN